MDRMNKLVRACLVIVFLIGCSVPKTEIRSKPEIPHVVTQMFGEVKGELGVTWLPLNKIELSKDNYDWEPIDRIIRKGIPFQLNVIFYVSDIVGNSYFTDYTPIDYPDGYTLVSGNKTCFVPPYDNSEFQSRYINFIKNFGNRYNGNNVLISVVACVGLDGETQATKDANMSWLTVTMDQQRPGLSNAFNKFVYKVIDAYAQYFPNTNVFLNNATGGDQRNTRADYAFSKGVFIKHSGGAPSLDSATGYNFSGSWDQLDKYRGKVWIESATGLPNLSGMMFSLYAMTQFQPVALDLHKEYFDKVPTEFTTWVQDHLGKTIENTPSVWSVMRDMEYPKVTWVSGGVTKGLSDWVGNFDYFMSVDGGRVITHSTYIDWRDRQYRYFDDYCRVDFTGFNREAYELRIVAKKYDTENLSVGWSTGNQDVIDQFREIQLSSWYTYTIKLYDISNQVVYIKGGCVHRVEVVEDKKPTPTPTKTSTPTPTPTKTSTPTKTTTPTITPTLTPTDIPTETSTPTDIPTETSTPTDIPTVPVIPTIPTKEALFTPTKEPFVEYDLWLPLIMNSDIML